MKILFVDDEINKYQSYFENYTISLATSKKEALRKIKENNFAAIFVNAKFNDNFLEQIRQLDDKPSLYLFNSTSNYAGLSEYATLIDGYYISPYIPKIEKTLQKLQYQNTFMR